MSSTITTTAMLVTGAILAASPALARDVHHHRHYRYAAAQPDGSGEPYGYRNAPYPQAYGGYYGTGRYGGARGAGYGYGYAGGWEAEADARLTAQSYRDPGLALELAPDAKQTATGGPVGGLPGRR